jgi:hypothetical protein
LSYSINANYSRTMMRPPSALKQLIKFFSLTVFIFLTSCARGQAMPIEKPSYYIQLKMNNCPWVVAVNGIQIGEDYDGNANNTKFPINHLIKNGANTFELLLGDEEYMKESTDASSVCEVLLGVSGTKDGEKINHKVTDLVFTPDYSGPPELLHKKSASAGNFRFEGTDQTILDPKSTDAIISDIAFTMDYFNDAGTSIKRTFTTNVSFPEWAFFKADKIFYYPISDDKYDQMKSQVWPLVLKLWDDFESKDFDRILPQFEMRSKEYDQAFYREPGETLNVLRAGIQADYNNNLPLNRKPNDKMQMFVSYTGTVVRIANAGTGNGTVMFYDKETDMNMFYDVFWMKKDGEWIIVR